MIHAYDEIYLENAMNCLGDLLEYAVLDIGMDPDACFKLFLDSSIARKFEIGNANVVAGHSGIELFYIIMEENNYSYITVPPVWRENRSDVFWAGWTLAYFQWYSNLPFSEIWNHITISKLQRMYPTYHEADIMKSVEMIQREVESEYIRIPISDLRKMKGWSQAQLARNAGMSISQLQRLEYGERKVENLSLKTALSLSQALGVDVRILE